MFKKGSFEVGGTIHPVAIKVTHLQFSKQGRIICRNFSCQRSCSCVSLKKVCEQGAEQALRKQNLSIGVNVLQFSAVWERFHQASLQLKISVCNCNLAFSSACSFCPRALVCSEDKGTFFGTSKTF